MDRALIQFICVRKTHRRAPPVDPSSPFNVAEEGGWAYCPGGTAQATLAYYNSGSRGWVAGRMGESAYLGTWASEPGQDRPSILGGDGQLGSPATGWPRYDRIAVQPAPYVGPGQVAWFQFTLKAPSNPGTYRLYVRPHIEPGLADPASVRAGHLDRRHRTHRAGRARVRAPPAIRDGRQRLHGRRPLDGRGNGGVVRLPLPRC